MLHVIREYALERLTETNDARAIHERHARTFLDLAESAAPKLMGAEQKPWLDRLELDHDNLRAALSWAVEEKDEAMVSRLLVSFWRFWQMRGHLFEGRLRAEEALAVVTEPAQRYTALEATGGIVYWMGDQDAANRYYGEALEIARGLNDKELLANALYNAAFPNTILGKDLPRSRQMFEEALALFREVGDEPGTAKVLWGIADLFYLDDPPDWQGAIDLLLEAQPIFEEGGDNFGLGWCLYTLGGCYIGTDDYAGSAEVLRQSLKLFRDADDKSGVVLLLDQIAILAIADGDLAGAAKLEGAGKALEKTSGVGLISSRAVIQPDFEAIAGRLPETNPKEWAEGEVMNLEHAITAALEWEPRSAPS